MIRFYAPDLEAAGELPEAESAHCCRVLRHRVGDKINVTDGKGHEFLCEIIDDNPRHTAVEILEKKTEEQHWPVRITLAVAPTKNLDRMEWLAEKAVEIGINRLVFIDCDHNVRRVVKRERIEKIMVSAMKQSLKSTLPELVEMTSFREFVAGDDSAKKYMGYCDDAYPLCDFSKEYDGKSDISIIIGPEGDFTPEEVEMAVSAGYKPVTFGNTRLRTETAALYSLCAAHSIIMQHS